MMPIATLLADSSPIISVIVVLLLVGLSLASQWLKARQQRAQEREADAARRRTRAPEASAFEQPEPRPTAPPDELGEDSAAGQRTPLSRRTAAPTGTVMPGAASRPRAQGQGRVVRRSPYQQATRRTVAAPPPPPPPPEPEMMRVTDELRHEQERRQRGELQRRRRMAARQSPEADTGAIEGRLVHVRPKTAAPAAPALGADPARLGQPAGAAVQVNLSDPEEARRAIIFHEILAQPKALRRAPEMWDA